MQNVMAKQSLTLSTTLNADMTVQNEVQALLAEASAIMKGFWVMPAT